jgi:hypothetical protein
MEDDRPCCSFFLEPVETFHRHYEALRAFFVEERSLTEIAKQFGYRHSSLRSMVSRFRAQLQAGEAPPFFPNPSEDEPSARVAYKNRPARRRRRPPTVDS